MFYHDVHICVIRVLILSDFLRSFKMRNMAVLARRVYCGLAEISQAGSAPLQATALG